MARKITRIVNIGQKFERLEVVDIISTQKILVKCNCYPDKIYQVNKYDLLNGDSTSCGCLSRDRTIQRNITHNLSKLRIYQTYNDIIQRCYHPKKNSYRYYGFKNIRVCQDWNPYLLGWEIAFQNFRIWADEHGYQEGLTIDRIDHDSHYSPNNCKWITRSKNCGKTRNNKYYTIDGISMYLEEWFRARKFAVSNRTIHKRLKEGMDFKDAVSLPPNSHYRKRK